MSEKRKWSFNDWSNTFDAIFNLYDKSNKIEDKIRYSQMLYDHCYKNYQYKWNRGLD